MRFGTVYFILIVLLPLIAATKSNANDESFIEVGLRGGTTFLTREDEGFLTYELFGVYGLPYNWQLGSDWIVNPRLILAAGLITNIDDDETEFITNFTPTLAITKKGWRAAFEVGGGFALLSDEDIGDRDHDFGGIFQFAAHGGISYRLSRNITAAYRFYHISDAGLFNGEGLNRHMLEIGYRF